MKNNDKEQSSVELKTKLENIEFLLATMIEKADKQKKAEEEKPLNLPIDQAKIKTFLSAKKNLANIHRLLADLYDSTLTDPSSTEFIQEYEHLRNVSANLYEYRNGLQFIFCDIGYDLAENALFLNRVKLNEERRTKFKNLFDKKWVIKMNRDIEETRINLEKYKVNSPDEVPFNFSIPINELIPPEENS